MTGKDTPQKYEGKISTIEDFYNMKFEGWHETQGAKGYWKMSKTGYFPIRIPQKLVKQYPSEFGEKIPQSPDLYQKISEREEQAGKKEGEKGLEEKGTEQITIAVSEASAIAPSTLIPEDFILSQQSKALIYGIIVNEGITKITKETKAPQITAKGTIDESGKEIAVSLADQAVRRLVEYYHRYKKVAEEIAMLQYEKGMLFEAGQIQQEKIKGLEEVIFVSSLTRR